MVQQERIKSERKFYEIKSIAERKFYDATIKSIDVEAKQTIIEMPDGLVRVFPKANWYHNQVGERGVLTVMANGDFLFWTYAEQQLRRWPEQDVPANKRKGDPGLWSWRLDDGEDRIIVKPGFIPGKGGQYVEDETEKVEIDVPPEFFDLCESKGLTVEQVLRGFIADVCGLQNLVNCPREDGFCSNGSDERMYAEQWFDRAFGGMFD